MILTDPTAKPFGVTTAENPDMLIRKDGGIDPELNFSSLRARALELVQQYCGEKWTDFNLHDPGVTILEALCFGLSDLAFRTSFPIEDIMAGRSRDIDREKNHFFPKPRILTTNPVSPDDYRKCILDNEIEIFNVWIIPETTPHTRNEGQYGIPASKPNIPRLYRVELQLAGDEKKIEDAGKESNEAYVALISRVKNLLRKNRNIGEDFKEPILLRRRRIDIHADIEITDTVVPEEVLADIYCTIQENLNPSIRFYTEEELKRRGYASEEIYDGPELRNGFFARDEVEKKKILKLDPADLLKETVSIPGVSVVRHLNIVELDKVNRKTGNIFDRCCYLEHDQYPGFDFEIENPGIHLYINNEQVSIKNSLFSNLLRKKTDLLKRRPVINTAEKTTETEPQELNRVFPLKGEFRNIRRYDSIQHIFPAVYNLLEDISTSNETKQEYSDEKQARLKQLKAYLMIFEQVLANYLAQLAELDNLYASLPVDSSVRTFYSQPLFQVPGAEYLLTSFSPQGHNDTKEIALRKEWEQLKKKQASHENSIPETGNSYLDFLYHKMEDPLKAVKRKSDVIDHMLCRFNLQPADYPAKLFYRFYAREVFDDENEMILRWKSSLLDKVPLLTGRRNQSIDYSHNPGHIQTEDIPVVQLGGFVIRMNHLLCFVDPDRYLENPRSINISTRLLSFTRHLEKQLTPAGKPESPDSVLRKNDPAVIKLDNGETIRVSIEPSLNQAEPAKGIQFNKIRLDFLKSGLSMNNFMVIHGGHFGKAGSMLLYRDQISQKSGNSEEPALYYVAGEFENQAAAESAMKKAIGQFRELNIRSEGFHLVEHILLRYRRRFNQFGFDIMDSEGRVIAIQKDWLSYYDREKSLDAIRALIKTLKRPTHLSSYHEKEAFVKRMADDLSRYCYVNLGVKGITETGRQFTDPYQLKYNLSLEKDIQKFNLNLDKLVKQFGDLYDVIDGLGDKRSTAFPAIAGKVKMATGREIPEDFFVLNMSVVLPNWPARFQGNGTFRSFVEKLFIDNSPLNMRLHFCWLTIPEMKKFEGLYFNWISRVHDQGMESRMNTDELISFLYDRQTEQNSL